MSSRAALEEVQERAIQVFPYAEANPATGTGQGSNHEAISIAEQQAANAGREEMARAAGRKEGEAGARAAFDEQVSRLQQSVSSAVADFAGERTAYFRQVEIEVVKLALSMARKIMHREAQVDPLLLAGMVRVALEQIDISSKVLLRVHPQRAAEYRDYFSRCQDAHPAPEVVDDPAVEADRCILQTTLGTTELGLEVQLKEIELGLLDILAKRPQAGR